jgi:surface polysaccharide O-acyltransferase-like enzyme
MKKSINSTSSRLLGPDIIRIVAIYLVIHLHTFSPARDPGLFQKFDILSVPLFVMLSGALLLNKQENYKTFFWKRCMKVLFPWIIWTIFYMIDNFNLQHSQITAEFFGPDIPLFYSWIHFFLRVFLSSFWFLPMIFSLYLITPLLRIFVKNATTFDNLYLIGLWFVIASVFPFLFNDPLFPIWAPNIILSPIYYSGYFLLGYVVIKQKIFKINNLFILILIAFFPFLISLLPLNSRAIHESATGFLYPGTVIASVFFFNFLLTASKRLEKYINQPVRKIITAISGASFGVFLIHGIFINIFEEKIIDFLRIFHTEFFLTLTTFCLLTIIIVILQRIPVLKKLVP